MKHLHKFLTTQTYNSQKDNLDAPCASLIYNRYDVEYKGVQPNNVIIYKSTNKLSETTSDKTNGLHTNRFYGEDNVQANIVSHIFKDGEGTITFDRDVTVLGDYVFYGATMSELKLPRSIESYNRYSFYGATLNSLTIPKAFKECGQEVFYAAHIDLVILENGITAIPNSMFANSYIKSVIIPNSVTSIGASAFQYCSYIEYITIPDSVTFIGENAFQNCSKLEGIKLSNNLTSLENNIFRQCTALRYLRIPKSVTSIGSNIFCGSVVEFESTIPPNQNNGNFYESNYGSPVFIYVPKEAVDAYQAKNYVENSYIYYCDYKEDNGHKYLEVASYNNIDFGVSIMNIGAENIEDYGDYYMYGKTEKYNPSQSIYTGTENPLDSSVDISTIMFGNNWHTPEEWELSTAFSGSYIKTYINGVYGIMYYRSFGYIFFPCTKEYVYGELSSGDSSSLLTSTPDQNQNQFRKILINQGCFSVADGRYVGCVVRPFLNQEPVTVKFKVDNSSSLQQCPEQSNYIVSKTYTIKDRNDNIVMENISIDQVVEIPNIYLGKKYLIYPHYTYNENYNETYDMSTKTQVNFSFNKTNISTPYPFQSTSFEILPCPVNFTLISYEGEDLGNIYRLTDLDYSLGDALVHMQNLNSVLLNYATTTNKEYYLKFETPSYGYQAKVYNVQNNEELTLSPSEFTGFSTMDYLYEELISQINNTYGYPYSTYKIPLDLLFGNDLEKVITTEDIEIYNSTHTITLTTIKGLKSK